jgi:hypothetical protein
MRERQVYEFNRRRSVERIEHSSPAFNIHAKAKRVRTSDLMVGSTHWRYTPESNDLQDRAQRFRPDKPTNGDDYVDNQNS